MPFSVFASHQVASGDCSEKAKSKHIHRIRYPLLSGGIAKGGYLLLSGGIAEGRDLLLSGGIAKGGDLLLSVGNAKGGNLLLSGVMPRVGIFS